MGESSLGKLPKFSCKIWYESGISLFLISKRHLLVLSQFVKEFHTHHADCVLQSPNYCGHCFPYSYLGNMPLGIRTSHLCEFAPIHGKYRVQLSLRSFLQRLLKRLQEQSGSRYRRGNVLCNDCSRDCNGRWCVEILALFNIKLRHDSWIQSTTVISFAVNYQY